MSVTFKENSTLFDDEVCTLNDFHSFPYNAPQLYARFHFLDLIFERDNVCSQLSMTNNDNSSDNNINLHHGNNDLQPYAPRNATLTRFDYTTQQNTFKP